MRSISLSYRMLWRLRNTLPVPRSEGGKEWADWRPQIPPPASFPTSQLCEGTRTEINAAQERGCARAVVFMPHGLTTRQVWSRANISLWRPNPPKGFVALGYVLNTEEVAGRVREGMRAQRG